MILVYFSAPQDFGPSRAVAFNFYSAMRDVSCLLQDYSLPSEAPLGSGAFGTVVKLLHRATGEPRAGKALAVSSTALRHLVATELQLLRRLRHVNLLRLHEAFGDQQGVYLVTELCRGGSLAQRLRRRMVEGVCCAYVEQMLSAASYCHLRGVLHRDLKPENVLFLHEREDSVVKVIDFGLRLWH